MKLILSTLALGTAAAAPMMQESSADAPKGEPLKVQVRHAEDGKLHTAKLAPKVWKVELAATPESPQTDDQEDLEKAAKELESELARLRAELEVMRRDLAKEGGDGAQERGTRRRVVVRERAENRRAEALEAAEGAHKEARNAAREARSSALAEARNARQLARETRDAMVAKNRTKGASGKNVLRFRDREGAPEGLIRFIAPDGAPMEGEAEAIIKYIDDGSGEAQVFVLKNGEQLPSKASKDVKRWAVAKVKGDAKAPKAPVELRWAVKGPAEGKGEAQRWLFKDDGGDDKRIAWVTNFGLGMDAHGEHEDHDDDHGEHHEHEDHDHGHDDHGDHDADGSTINIHVEHGDVHIHAGGSSIHTSGGHGEAPKPHKIGLFGKMMGGDKEGSTGHFGMKTKGGQNGPGIFGGKAIRKVIVNGKEIDSSAIEMPDGFFFDSKDGDSNFSFGFSGEFDLEDITEEIADAIQGEYSEEITEEISDALGGLGGLEQIKFINGPGGLVELKNLEGLGGILKLENIDGEGRILDLGGGNSWFGTTDGHAPETVKVKTITENGETRTRVFINGEEVDVDLDEDGEEESDEDERFVWLRGPKAPTAAPPRPGTMAWPSPPAAAPKLPGLPMLAGVPLLGRPTLPTSALAPRAASSQASADAELAALAREIREELQAMRAEIRALRAEVMRAPKAPAPLARRGRNQPAPGPRAR